MALKKTRSRWLAVLTAAAALLVPCGGGIDRIELDKTPGRDATGHIRGPAPAGDSLRRIDRIGHAVGDGESAPSEWPASSSACRCCDALTGLDIFSGMPDEDAMGTEQVRGVWCCGGLNREVAWIKWVWNFGGSAFPALVRLMAAAVSGVRGGASNGTRHGRLRGAHGWRSPRPRIL